MFEGVCWNLFDKIVMWLVGVVWLMWIVEYMSVLFLLRLYDFNVF